eukprot:m.152403 g.152403  ORF g.152403 m.152403 type:complete len:141 (+) comp16210_c1_seq28:2479-2901(+)
MSLIILSSRFDPPLFIYAVAYLPRNQSIRHSPPLFTLLASFPCHHLFSCIFIDRQIPAQTSRLTLKDALTLLKAIDKKNKLQLQHEQEQIATLERDVSKQLAWLDGDQADALRRMQEGLDVELAKGVYSDLRSLLESDSS